MDATKLLKTQHAEVTELFEQYEEADDAAEKRQLFVKIADDLSAHATIEEKLFYPAVYVGEMKDLLQESVEEHLEAKRLIADLLELDSASADFDVKMAMLKDAIEHHVEEEEGELFPRVRKSFTKDELDALGTEMKAMFDELKQGEPRMQVPAETGQPAPLE